MRLIDANKVERKLRIAISSWQRDCNSNAPVIARAMEDALQRVIWAPTVDAVEVVHGRWFAYDNDPMWQECSVCGYRIQYSYSKDCNYCPNCGADMRERKDNGTV